MYIHYIRIQNYRNFKDVEMTFHDKANYLVGENAIGKSGFLRLLKLMSEGSGITENDYADPDVPLIVTVELVLLDSLNEYFYDLPEEHRESIRVRMEKRVEEVYPRLYDVDTEEELPLDVIRRIRYISYSASMAEEGVAPARVYRALERMLTKWGSKQLDTFSPELKAFINHEARYGSLDSSFYVDIFLLSCFLSREDRPRADNMKFISVVALEIITQIYLICESKAVPLEHTLIVDQAGHRWLPLITSIDEPEIHLHPYMQRSVLNYYKRLLNNEDPQFVELLKGLFHIDGLRGQMFVVTHSTDSLVDDYRNIVRFYRDDYGQVRAACGAKFHFNEEIEKHLIMHFPEVKEALYSRSVIIVEGETEYGCFSLFGTTLGLPFDYYGICLINARGESSISKIRKLLEFFRIPTVVLYDADVKNGREREPYTYFTDGICFEMDLAKTMIDHNHRRDLDHIIDAVNGEHARASTDMLKRACRKLDVNYHDYPPRRLWNVNPRNHKALYIYYFAWLYSNKGVILGRLIGQSLPAELIPPAFVKTIRAAGNLAKVTIQHEAAEQIYPHDDVERE
ncbi:ATP-dependent nuclease [Megasphaera hominis]|jgi:putative ATP-dependent endonuclease of OLD family|uniref:AAA family ATPase n=1 Tax=Megasphaera hominis TaxID=159836 RepID=A0ABR6VJX0_9FIRM|nr:AAA family ATPase [Megasphaera hominis]MBC3537582.1 AAA family ATPase [Megasphaera hominis]